MTRSLWVLVIIALTVTGCARDEPGGEGGERALRTDGGPFSVYVVNYPLCYFAERIGGDLVDVVFPAPADEDPAFWTPAPEVIAAYQGADLILLNGADYAKWVARASLPQARLVNTSASFADRLIALEDAVTHAHGPGGEHEHGGSAFTTWLDPTLAIEQARVVTEALTRATPGSETVFRSRFEALAAELEGLDRRLAAVSASMGDEPLVFSHPVYQYFARRYQLNGQSVHWEPDENASDEMWRDLEEVLSSHPARWMIWEGEPLAETVRELEKRGIRSLVYDPCGSSPEEGDFLAMMQRNVNVLEAAFAR
jgi:zinc transport system substrate-binding protein